MEERLYQVEVGENAVDFIDIPRIEHAVAKFIIKSGKHAINDQWNGVMQADLEGYVLAKEEETLVAYKIIGFGKDSKVYFDIKEALHENDRLVDALRFYCNAYEIRTNEKLTDEEVEKLLKIV